MADPTVPPSGSKPMRFIARRDLGGYASQLPVLEQIAGIELEKPFVLLCGPNGSGKTALLRAMRLSLGLMGERLGRGLVELEENPLALLPKEEQAGRERNTGTFWREQILKQVPFLLDVEKMGWSGQRSWLFDSRKETSLVSGAGSLDADLNYHVMKLASGGGRVSHGQALRGGWWHAIEWALGGIDAGDPFDRGVSDTQALIWERFAAGAAPAARPCERWLLLDEPEVALDVEAQVTGLAAIVANAEIGHLRVFCASHSPLFAAGLGEHPNVQVLDLSPPGTKSWYSCLKRGLEIVGDMTTVIAVGRDIRCNVEKARQRREEQAARELEKLRQQAAVLVEKLPWKDQAGIVLARRHPDGRAPERVGGMRNFDWDRADGPLQTKGIFKNGKLTPLGRAIGDLLIEREFDPADEPPPKPRAARKKQV